METERIPIINRNKNAEDEGWWNITHTVTLLCFIMFSTQCGMIVNTSVTIVAMADEFSWDETSQGHVLGSFYYGYLLTTIIGGRAAEILGGRLVVSVSLLGVAVISFVTPVVSAWSFKLLVGVKVVQGLITGPMIPSLTFFMTKWVTVDEKTKVTARVWSGEAFGTFLMMFAGGWLTSSLGWPSVFYVTGGVAVIVAVVFLVVLTEDPKDMKRLPENTKRRILEGRENQGDEQIDPVPWKAILKSPSVWTMTGVHVASNATFYGLATELPTYLVNIVGFSLTSAGVISGVSYLTSWIYAVIHETVATYLLKKQLLNQTHVRRISQAICCYGCSLCFLAAMFTIQPAIVATIFLLNVSFIGAEYSGYFPSPSDVSPRFSGTISGFIEAFSIIPAFMMPAIIGALTNNNQTHSAWNYAFLILILINVILGSPYIFTFKAEVQPWNNNNSHHNSSGTVNDIKRTEDGVAEYSDE